MDESIHEDLGFIVVAYVLSRGDLGAVVADALNEAGLRVGRDEFKSSELMSGRPELRRVRERLYEAARDRSQLALLVAPSSKRSELGREILETLGVLVLRNGFDVDELEVHLDEGLFRSTRQALIDASQIEALTRSRVFPEQDSKQVLGLQVADAVAHGLAQLLREGLKETPKIVKPGEAAGLLENEGVALSWEILLALRYGLLRRPLVYQTGDGTLRYATSGRFKQRTPPSAEMESRILLNDDDVATLGQNAEVLGWGLFLSNDLPERLRLAAESCLGRVWMGCMH